MSRRWRRRWGPGFPRSPMNLGFARGLYLRNPQAKGDEQRMLANSKAYSGFSVDDLEQAREFYGQTLGLKIVMLDEENGLMTLHLAGDRPTLVYRGQNHEPGSYTVLNHPVDDIDEAVDGLAARAVRFEQY